MPVSYRNAPIDVLDVLSEVLCKHDDYQPILAAKVTFDVLMAYAPLDATGAPTGPAIKHNGIAAVALASKTSLIERVSGCADCRILIDAAWWTREGRTHEQRMALLDHELYHFEVVLDKDALVRDSAKRPKIDIRKHDVEFGWFRQVARRNGANSIECTQASELLENDCQTFWPEILGARL